MKRILLTAAAVSVLKSLWMADARSVLCPD